MLRSATTDCKRHRCPHGILRRDPDVEKRLQHLIVALTEAEPIEHFARQTGLSTAETRRLIDEHALEQMQPHAWVVNVARGELVDTEALVAALRAGRIGGAALDAVDPEPLPDGHPLWGLPNAIVTPHTAATLREWRPLFADRVAENVGRFARGEPLLGTIDPELGY